MSCTTILVGKSATYDGSTIIARNEDEVAGRFTPQRMAVIHPQEQPRVYKSVISHVEIDLSGLEPQRYTSVPDALGTDGIWAAAGVNENDVAMNATETLTTNPRVLGADPLVELQAAKGTPGTDGYVPEVPGGLGEEDFVTLVLPYIHTAREGVLRLGELLERYGTYEMNGIAFSDLDEIWWLETVGGHHWIARRVPDDCYVTMPNQLGIDWFDLADAEGSQRDCLCSPDLRSWMAEHHLDLTMRSEDDSIDVFNPREAFGSASDADHVYNTPRAWDMQRYLNPTTSVWEGPRADYTSTSDNIPWARRPERLVTIEDVKYTLSLHYQGTQFDCYGDHGGAPAIQRYRPIGVNRTNELSVLQLRPSVPTAGCAVHWITYGSNVFNALVPLYAQVEELPTYFCNTAEKVTTESFYWTNRLIGALADAHFNSCLPDIERYQQEVGALGYAALHKTDRALSQADDSDAIALLEGANEQVAQDVRDATDRVLSRVLHTASLGMRNAFARSDG